MSEFMARSQSDHNASTEIATRERQVRWANDGRGVIGQKQAGHSGRIWQESGRQLVDTFGTICL